MKRAFLLVAAGILLSSPSFAEKTAYFSALPDLPVAPRLAEEVNSAAQFKQPEGKIVVLAAQGPTEPSDIIAFYQKALPAMGWKQATPNRYIHGRRVLLLDVKEVDEDTNRLSLLVRPR